MFSRKKIFPDNASFDTPAARAFRQLKKNKTALAGLFLIVISAVIAVLGYLIIPDKTPDANEIIPEISLQRPGFKMRFLLVRKEKQSSGSNIFSTMLFGKENDYRMIPILNYKIENDKLLVSVFMGEGLEPEQRTYSLADVVYANSLSHSSETVTADSVTFINLDEKEITVSLKDLQKEAESENIVSRRFWLGTDTYGRDIFSRLILGVRVSLSVGLVAVLISLIIGITLGALAGFYLGWVDKIISWLINVIWAIPTLLLVFAITLALGKGFWQIFFAVGLTMWVEVARIIRGQVMGIREMQYVEAAKALGFKDLRIIFRHILPNIIGPVLVIAAAKFASAILIEAGLSFLGIGVQPPTPSWGSMIKDNYGFIISSTPYLAIIPGIAIMILVLAFNLLGNGLRDTLDVKTKFK